MTRRSPADHTNPRELLVECARIALIASAWLQPRACRSLYIRRAHTGRSSAIRMRSSRRVPRPSSVTHDERVTRMVTRACPQAVRADTGYVTSCDLLRTPDFTCGQRLATE